MAMTQAEYEAEVRRRLGADADAFLRTHPTPLGVGVGGGGAPPSTLTTTTTGLSNQLSSAIDRARRAGLSVLNSPRTFTFEDLRRAASAVEQVGGEIPVPDARFQDPEAIMQMIQQMQGLFEPLTQARTAAMEADYNRLQQQLRNRLAAIGSLVGGGAVAQQQDVLQRFLRDLDAVRAESLAQAIPLALDAARLGLSEAEMLYAMQDRNRQFLLQRQQQFFDNLARGMSLEEAERQFRAGLEADLAQNYVQNLLNQMGFEESRRQFDIGTALRMAEMFGISPTMSLPEMFRQAQGQMPLSFRQALAGLTGIDPVTGQPSFAARESELNRALNLFNILGEATGPLAEILGIDPGTRTAQLRLGLLSRAGAGGGGGVSQNEALLQAAYVQARDMFQQGNQQGAFDHLIMSGYSDTAARRIIDTWREFGFDEEDTRIAAQADQLANQLGITFDGGLFILEMRESGWSKARALNELEREPLSPAEKNIIRQFINQEFAEDTPARSGNRQVTIPEIAVPNAPLRFPPSHLPQNTGPARTDIPAGTFFPWFLHIQR